MTVIYIAAIIAAFDYRLETTRYVVESSKIPEQFDGFQIAVVSDFHNSRTKSLVPKIKSLNVDILVFTGDLFDEYLGNTRSINIAKELAKIAPAYYTSGNHDVSCRDFSTLLETIQTAGIIPLEDSSCTIHKGESSITFHGITDPNILRNCPPESAISKSLKTVKPTDGFDILLFHRAGLLEIFDDYDFDLILSGHIHGGQIRIPFIGGFYSPHLKFFPKICYGRREKNGVVNIISRGLGNKVPIPRLFNRPELVVVELRAGQG